MRDIFKSMQIFSEIAYAHRFAADKQQYLVQSFSSWNWKKLFRHLRKWEESLKLVLEMNCKRSYTYTFFYLSQPILKILNLMHHREIDWFEWKFGILLRNTNESKDVTLTWQPIWFEYMNLSLLSRVVASLTLLNRDIPSVEVPSFFKSNNSRFMDKIS